jgi:hypothetical protein
LEDTISYVSFSKIDYTHYQHESLTSFYFHHSFQASKQACSADVRGGYTQNVDCLFIQRCPLFFWDWDVLFSLFWIGLGFFGNGNGIGDEDEDEDEEAMYV